MIKKTMETKIPKVKWDEYCKIRIANPNPSFEKHEIIKTLLVMKLQHQHKHEKKYVRIYTEHPIRVEQETRKCDVYYENIKTKEQYAIEIQKDYSVKWLNGIKEFYQDWDKQLSTMFFKTSNVITIKMDNLSDDISELSKQLKEFIV
jgi:Uma2 family endonuclease